MIGFISLTYKVRKIASELALSLEIVRVKRRGNEHLLGKEKQEHIQK